MNEKQIAEAMVLADLYAAETEVDGISRGNGSEHSKARREHLQNYLRSLCQQGKFKRGDRVRKVSGSEWEGVVVGEYSTAFNPEGYAVESCAHKGTVQIYPAKALDLVAGNHSEDVLEMVGGENQSSEAGG